MYDITISEKALKSLKKIHNPIKRRIAERIDLIVQDTENGG